MKAVTAAEMSGIDRRAIEEYGVPQELLMGYAGREVCSYVMSEFSEAERICVFCGDGNNGGDGFAAAYLLSNVGKSVKAVFAGDERKLSSASAIFLSICRKSSVPVIAVTDREDVVRELDSTDLIVDSVLGTGTSGAPRGLKAEAVTLINQSGLPVLSVDIPSGLPSDGHAPEGEAVKASATVTFGLPKLGMVVMPGREYCGKVAVADIGFPLPLVDSSDLGCSLIDRGYISRLQLNPLRSDTHKGERGHLLVMGGFDGMEGAAILAAEAALEAGVGMVTVMTTCSSRNVIAGRQPEIMTVSLPAGPDESEFRALIQSRRYDVVLAGPGMGRSEYSRSVFHLLLKLIPETQVQRVLLDADALFHYEASCSSGCALPEGAGFLITPHFMEASRILGEGIAQIKADRPAAARRLAEMTGSAVLLKGPASIAVSGQTMNINTSGNPVLATGGTGDVLAGIAAAFLLRDISVLDAASAAAFVHGAAADIFREENGPVMKSSDLLRYIRRAITGRPAAAN